jgi:GH25 family lysozyme M1 (1,4-beta-N-acetylmuramidase)
MTVELIDVSNHQGRIDWGAVAGSGVRGAFIKATEGTWFQDDYFPRNWWRTADNELWRGAYHFARPGRTPSGAAEANYFCDYVLASGTLAGDMYVVDLEEGPPGADLGAYLLDFCQTVRARTGVKPLIYSTGYMLQHWKCATPELSEYGLWLAAPGATHVPAPPAPWDVTAFWQYDWHGRVPGVSGDCDRDRFNGDEDRLALYGVPT